MPTSFVHHICIQTDRYDESVRFYTEGLGFTLVKETPNFHDRDYNTWLQLSGFYIELQTAKKNELLGSMNKHNQGIVHMSLWVKDLEKEVAKLSQMNARFLKKNSDKIYFVENGQLCKVQAPEGTIIELRDQKNV